MRIAQVLRIVLGMATTETSEAVAEAPDDAEWLRVSRVAKRLDFSPGYVYVLIEQGLLVSKHFGNSRKGIRVSAASVAEFIKES